MVIKQRSVILILKDQFLLSAILNHKEHQNGLNKPLLVVYLNQQLYLPHITAILLTAQISKGYVSGREGAFPTIRPIS